MGTGELMKKYFCHNPCTFTAVFVNPYETFPTVHICNLPIHPSRMQVKRPLHGNNGFHGGRR
jgi:hypothetical protein